MAIGHEFGPPPAGWRPLCDSCGRHVELHRADGRCPSEDALALKGQTSDPVDILAVTREVARDS